MDNQKLNNFFTTNTFCDNEAKRTTTDQISLRNIEINMDTFEMTVNNEVFKLDHDLTFMLIQEFPEGFTRYNQ